MKVSLLVSLVGQSVFVFAQTLTPSSSWRNYNITTTLAQRISTADVAIQKAISNLNAVDLFNGSAFGIPALLYAEMAEFDIATNQTKYHSQLLQFFQNAQSQRANFEDELCLNYGLAYGYAAARAYVAYNDSTFLNWAAGVWSFGQTFTVSSSDASTGTSQAGVKSFPIQGQCQGITMAGGTFWNTDPDDPSLNGLATGYYLVNSALLAEATSNQTYLDAATQAATFIHSHLYNINNAVQDTISARQNDSCATSNTVGPYNSGLMIEGLAILASLKNDTDTQSLLLNTVSAAVTSQAWQGSDGVIADGTGKSGSLELVRGLLATYNRNKANSNLRNYLKDYIAVQYNAIMDQATVSGSNIYGSSWEGPPATAFLADNQTTSLIGLIGSIYLVNDTTTSTNSSGGGNGSGSGGGSNGGNSASEDNDGSTSSSKAGPIAGGVVGGLAFLAILAALAFFFYRRKKRQLSLGSEDPEPAIPVPFMMTQTGDAARPYNPYETTTSSGTTGTVSSPLSVPLRREKQGLHRQNLSSGTGQVTESGTSSPPPPPQKRPQLPQSHSIADSISPSRSSEDPVALASGSGNQRGVDLPTSELVRLLNERLQPEQWNDDEVPPEYQHQSVPTR